MPGGDALRTTEGRSSRRSLAEIDATELGIHFLKAARNSRMLCLDPEIERAHNVAFGNTKTNAISHEQPHHRRSTLRRLRTLQFDLGVGFFCRTESTTSRFFSPSCHGRQNHLDLQEAAVGDRHLQNARRQEWVKARSLGFMSCASGLLACPDNADH